MGLWGLNVNCSRLGLGLEVCPMISGVRTLWIMWVPWLDLLRRWINQP
jgi:hypothetical protein